MNITRNKTIPILYALYYFFALCPFISPIRLASDIQPFAVIISCIVLVSLPKILRPKCMNQILAILFVATLLWIVSCGVNSTEVFQITRKYYNYFSLYIVTIAGVNVFLKQGGINELWIKRVIILWLVAALIEIVYPPFSQIILPGSRTTAGRGVVGLAMEPSFYGYTMFFFFILAGEFKENRKFFQMICIAQILLLAQSSIAAVFLLLYFFLWILEQLGKLYKESPRRVINIIAMVIAIVFGIYMVWLYLQSKFENSRMVLLVQKLSANITNINNLDDLYAVDWSVAERIEAIVIGLGKTASAFGAPHGFVYYDLDVSRIMSGYGTAMYELGWFGIWLVILLTNIIRKAYRKSWSKTLTITAVMFAAIQLGSPTFAFLIAVAIYKKAHKYKLE